MSPLVRNNIMRNSEIVNKVFSKSMDKCLFQGEQISIIWFKVITCHQMFSGTSEVCGILRATSVSALASRTFNSTLNQISFGEAKPVCKCYPCHHDHFVPELPESLTDMHGYYSCGLL